MMRWAWLFLASACLGFLVGTMTGCSAQRDALVTPESDDAAETQIKRRVGEVHLHGYGEWGHVEPLFIAPGTPIGEVDFDSSLPILNPITLVAGDCMVRAAVPCGEECASLSTVDGGIVNIDGLARPIAIGFHPEVGGYYDDVVFSDGLFVGGETIGVRTTGSTSVPAFATSIVMPQAIAPTTSFDAGIAVGLDVGWHAVNDGSRVRVALDAFQDDGGGASVVCDYADSVEHVSVPGVALAMLPPPPRALALQISRYRLQDVPVGHGDGVVIHAGFTAQFARHEY